MAATRQTRAQLRVARRQLLGRFAATADVPIGPPGQLDVRFLQVRNLSTRSQEVLEDSEPCPYRGRARLRAHDPLEQKLVLQDLYWRVGSEGNARRVRFPRRSDDCQRDGFF